MSKRLSCSRWAYAEAGKQVSCSNPGKVRFGVMLHDPAAFRTLAARMGCSHLTTSLIAARRCIR